MSCPRSLVLQGEEVHSLVLRVFNRTTLVVTGHELRARHGPLPGGGAPVLLARGEIASLGGQRRHIHARQADAGHTPTTIRISYEVVARLRSGREVALTSPVSEPSEAHVRHLEQRLCEHLGLVTTPGEHAAAWRVAADGALPGADPPLDDIDEMTLDASDAQATTRRASRRTSLTANQTAETRK